MNLEVFIVKNMETKFCNGCKLDLPKTTEFFATRVDRKNVQFQSLCKECQKKYRRAHYLKNKSKYISMAIEQKKNLWEWFVEYRKTLKCSKCNESRYWVLDFHHPNNDKESNVVIMARKGTKRKLLNEINKCIVLCSNCHRDLHHQEKTHV